MKFKIKDWFVATTCIGILIASMQWVYEQGVNKGIKDTEESAALERYSKGYNDGFFTAQQIWGGQ